MVDSPFQFGEFSPGQKYVDRPGAYGIAVNPNGLVLTVAVRNLLALPGGGLEPHESWEAGLIREYREETGHQVRITDYVGSANQFVYAKDERTHFNKICRFFRVTLIGAPERPVDKDHRIRWITSDEARNSLSEAAHCWAVTQALEP